MQMQVSHKSLNLLDFARNREKDLFLLDVNSDRTQNGGISETELRIMQDSQGETFRKYLSPFLTFLLVVVNIEAKFKKDRSGLLQINHMFCGF